MYSCSEKLLPYLFWGFSLCPSLERQKVVCGGGGGGGLLAVGDFGVVLLASW